MEHICDVCDKTYTRIDSLNRHINNKRHPQDGWKKCPGCNDWYKGLGSHWKHNSSHRPDLSQKQKEVITGLLMSDGCINRQKNTNPRFRCAMVTKPFIEYLSSKIFPTIGKDIRIIEPGKNNVQKQYEFVSCVHPEFEEFAEWYNTGDKVFPNNIELSPTVLKMWYVGDGHLYNDEYNTMYPIISALNEINNKEKLFNYFEKLPFDIRRFTWKDIIIEQDDTEKFFEYIGDPVPGFEYKWP